jgi:diguanylate cyclase (GGDEF)-like protein
MSSTARGDHAEAAPADRSREGWSRGRRLRSVEVASAFPLLVWIVWCAAADPTAFRDPTILVWVVALIVVGSLPVPSAVSSAPIRLGFPVELSIALIYPPPVAALIAFVGTTDRATWTASHPFVAALRARVRVAVAVICQSWAFRAIATLESPWWRIAIAVGVAAVVGYAVGLWAAAVDRAIDRDVRLSVAMRSIRVGAFGEFVPSLLGLAVVSVLVAITFEDLGSLAIAIFVAPLAFARQMLSRTHSLRQATEELAVKRAENEHQALHDSLTGLPNRELFQLRLAEAIAAAERRRGRLAVMLMDLDHFKEINDTLGHHFGDRLLTEIGPRLSSVLRDGDVIARLGGDEFGVLLADLPEDQVAFAIAARLLEELTEPVSIEGLALDVSGSLGIAIYPTQSSTAESLLRRADVAMYAAKEAGGGYELYTTEMDQHSPGRLTLVSQVRPALERGEFEMHYQPKVRLHDGRVAGAEALVRWQHPERGSVPPDEFIPLVERTVLLGPLTFHVMEQVMRQWRVWADEGMAIPIAVNLSPRSLLDRSLPETVRAMLERFDMPPPFLRLELTEHFLMSDSGRSSTVLDELAAVGVSLSIDDFGTGYSSLSHLKRLPIDEIKIDRSFVIDMNEDANDFLIVRATVELGRHLGLRVVAEGVEDRETFDRLADFGCDEAQGFYISKPMSRDEFSRWLSVRNPEAIVHEGMRGRTDIRPASASR